MQQKTILNEFGKPVQFGYAGSRPSWRKHEDALDRSSIIETEEKVLSHGNRLELLSTLRDLERNNPIAKSIVQVFVSNLGSCQFLASEENINQELTNDAFRRYFKNCEITGHGMQKVLGQIITDMLLAGEAFVLLTKGGSFQLIPSERIASSHDPAERRANEVEGIALNNFGLPIAYRVAGVTDGRIDFSTGKYVPAKDMIHIANTSRIGQLRGTPMLASATKTLEDIHEVQTAYTAKVKTASALTGFITSNQPNSARWDGNEFAEEPMRSSYKKLYSGSLLLLEAGESVQTVQGGAVDGVDRFLTQLISFACSSVGITVENLVGWSNASFSSSKATRAVTNHRFAQIREHIESSFLRRLCKWRIYKWENNDELPVGNGGQYEGFDFQWSTAPTLDRRQDAQTDAVLLENGLASKSTIFANNGMNYEEELKKMAKDKEMETSILGDRFVEDEESLLSLDFATYNDYPKSASNNAKKALKYRDKNKVDCGTPVGWARANQLANGEKISRETIARMASFKRHQQHKDVPYSKGCGGLMWDAWGGTSGIEWAIRKLEQIDKG
jgi:capsid protein